MATFSVTRRGGDRLADWSRRGTSEDGLGVLADERCAPPALPWRVRHPFARDVGERAAELRMFDFAKRSAGAPVLVVGILVRLAQRHADQTGLLSLPPRHRRLLVVARG